MLGQAIDGATGRRGLLLLGLFAVALVAAGAAGLIGFSWQALNQQEARREVFLVRQALERRLARMTEETASDAAWDEAFAKTATGRFDPLWADTSVASYFHTTFHHDLTLVFDGRGRLVYASRTGRRADPAGMRTLEAQLAPLVRKVQLEDLTRRRAFRGREVKATDVTQGFASAAVRWGPDVLLLGLSSVAPSLGLAEGEDPPTVFVSGQRLDARFLDRLHEDLGIKQARFGYSAVRGLASVPVVNPRGAPVGYLAWRLDRPAFQVISQAGGWIAAAVVLLALTGAGIAGLTRRALVRLEANDRALEAAMAELRQARDAAEAANDAKSQFLANMSHEIRTPLNGVLGMAQALERDEPHPERKSRIQVILQSGKALLTVLNDVIDISRIEAGKLEIAAAPFDLGELVDGVADTYADVAAAKDVVLERRIADGARGLFLGDGMRIRQILLNLVSNALKFTEHGRVAISAETVPEGVVFRVSDTGVGLSPEQQGRLFQKFSQVDGSQTRRFSGAGLGLAICRELCDLMGGRIEVESAPGQGSSFSLHLPLRPAAGEGARLEARAQAGGVQRPLRLLAAEDNETNRQVLHVLLEPIGCELTTVANGREALEAFRTGRYDAILMDVQMPVMSGVEATRMIRAMERREGLARTPILALSANVMTHQLEEYEAAGMDGHVGKPIEVERLFAMLSRTLDRSDQAAPERLAV